MDCTPVILVILVMCGIGLPDVVQVSALQDACVPRQDSGLQTPDIHLIGHRCLRCRKGASSSSCMLA